MMYAQWQGELTDLKEKHSQELVGAVQAHSASVNMAAMDKFSYLGAQQQLQDTQKERDDLIAERNQLKKEVDMAKASGTLRINDLALDKDVTRDPENDLHVSEPSI